MCKFREICQNAHQLKAVDVRDFGVYERGFQVRRYGGGGCASGGAVMGETFQATSLHTPCGVEGMGADVSTWGSCCVGLGKGCEGVGAAGGRRPIRSKLLEQYRIKKGGRGVRPPWYGCLLGLLDLLFGEDEGGAVVEDADDGGVGEGMGEGSSLEVVVEGGGGGVGGGLEFGGGLGGGCVVEVGEVLAEVFGCAFSADVGVARVVVEGGVGIGGEDIGAEGYGVGFCEFGVGLDVDVVCRAPREGIVFYRGEGGVESDGGEFGEVLECVVGD